MRNNNGHQKSSCAFAETSAAYLYDEIGDSEKLSFESHLRDCQTCADELADFSFLRSSIQEWRAADFEPLPTPAFVIPTSKQTISEKPSWFETLKSYLNFSPQVSAAMVAVIFVMIAGIIWLAESSSHQESLAQNEKPTIQEKKAAAQPENELKNQPKNDNETIAAVSKSPATSGKPLRAPQSEVKNKNLKTEEAWVKTSTRAPSSVKSDKQSLPTMAKEIRPKAPNKNDIPTLTVGDDEDDSLRLSDLFDEVGTANTSEVNND
ncbi:MAG: anti-sigma factor family protein [Pyrinomonadaceae bacterium]